MTRRKPVTAADPTITGCLARLAGGYTDAAGVLTDYLEETAHPLAPRVRKATQSWSYGLSWWRSADMSRRRVWTRWEAVAAEHRKVRRIIARLFRRSWRSLTLRQFYDRNEGDTP
jgi:hypothetical protein